MLQLVVGPEARRQISQSGLQPELFDKVIAASGGPKWIPLAALDRHLLYQFFPAEQPLSLLGTSSGAWRCTTLSNPGSDAAHRRLQHAYIHQRYDRPPTPAEVDVMCEGILSDALGECAPAICDNPYRQLNIIVCRGRHLNDSGRRGSQLAGLAFTALTNLARRRSLSMSWQRLVASTGLDTPFVPMDDLPTEAAPLDANNLLPVMLASGSIPLVLSGVTGIPGLPPGRYFDGGVTDYHLDLPALQRGGLTLYPHFYPHAAPGWFDKKLPWRRASTNFDKVAILTPDPTFIARLPRGRLPDRSDFKTLDSDRRIRDWERAAELGEALVDTFQKLVQDPMPYLRSL
ncbi:alpha/beta hydrolase [Ferrimonas balearica]|uniref:alpha/beta hydrolase n=1 Tax=Ferrimonas balearica TaxID=44012 RepID=UPI001C986B7B|nr:alpha/beta hydrolase [Ferrimonas balearica]MBY5981254.1 alpha/beta hydrolase [Ferrimonas balearica]